MLLHDELSCGAHEAESLAQCWLEKRDHTDPDAGHDPQAVVGVHEVGGTAQIVPNLDKDLRIASLSEVKL